MSEAETSTVIAGGGRVVPFNSHVQDGVIEAHKAGSAAVAAAAAPARLPDRSEMPSPPRESGEPNRSSLINIALRTEHAEAVKYLCITGGAPGTAVESFCDQVDQRMRRL